MTDCSWNPPEDVIICELNQSRPCSCPLYAGECVHCKHDNHSHCRALTMKQVEWAILKIREGYKTRFISNALHVTDKTLQRNIFHYTGLENIGDILRYYPPIELQYKPEEVSEWEVKLP